MISSGRLVAFVPSADPERSRLFYEETLGLHLVDEAGGAFVFDVNGGELRLVRVDAVRPEPHTLIGWEVDDIEAEVTRLQDAGVVFSDFDFLDDENPAVWTAPDGRRIAWFNDPDGHVLSLSNRPA